ncbi:hypothetical protein ACWGI8_12350 [Streptomyces sp. NPDC054841]
MGHFAKQHTEPRNRPHGAPYDKRDNPRATLRHGVASLTASASESDCTTPAGEGS